MSIKPIQMLCPQSLKTCKFPYSMTPTRIVVHNTANDASAVNEITYMNNNRKQVSFHFAIDDKDVVQGLPLNVNGWHAGDGANGKGNREGIGIEICYSKSGGHKFIEAEKLAAKFIAQLLTERGWGIDRVTKHQDYSGKYCPHRTLDMGWDRFIKMIDANIKQDAVNINTGKPSSTTTKYKIGDKVTVSSGYKSSTDGQSNAVIYGTNTKSGTITRIESGARNPYLISADNGAPICWCNDGDIRSVVSAKSIDEIAREVIAGKWGNGAERKAKITAAGYDYKAVQEKVNELLK